MASAATASVPTAVVTGAGSGLGREIALRLLTAGHHVYVTDVDEAAAKATAAAGDRSTAVGLDVRDGAACTELAARAVREHGRLDVWVNNAGVLTTGAVWTQDETTRRRMLEINTLGTINGTVAALAEMRPARCGNVINVVSLAGIVPTPGEAVYSASKHAALAFSVATMADLRVAGERDVRISCLCPDGIWTPMLEHTLDDPSAASSYTGVMLMPGEVADRAVGLIDRPRLVLALPRQRGLGGRIASAVPGAFVAAAPLVARLGRFKQRRFAARLSVQTPEQADQTRRTP